MSKVGYGSYDRLGNLANTRRDCLIDMFRADPKIHSYQYMDLERSNMDSASIKSVALDFRREQEGFQLLELTPELLDLVGRPSSTLYVCNHGRRDI